MEYHFKYSLTHPLCSALIPPQLSWQYNVFISALNQILCPGLQPVALWRSETSLISSLITQQLSRQFTGFLTTHHHGKSGVKIRHIMSLCYLLFLPEVTPTKQTPFVVLFIFFECKILWEEKVNLVTVSLAARQTLTLNLYPHSHLLTNNLSSTEPFSLHLLFLFITFKRRMVKLLRQQ